MVFPGMKIANFFQWNVPLTLLDTSAFGGSLFKPPSLNPDTPQGFGCHLFRRLHVVCWFVLPVYRPWNALFLMPLAVVNCEGVLYVVRVVCFKLGQEQA